MSTLLHSRLFRTDQGNMLEQAGISGQAASGFIERRRAYRQRMEASALLRAVNPQATDDEQPVPVHVFEYSMTGVAFSSSMPLKVGTIFRFDMCDKRHASRRVEIRSCRPRRDGMFDLGAMFC